MNSFEESVAKLVNSSGVDLYDIEVVKENEHQVLRVYITSKDGINLDKCQEISNLISPLLDVENPVSGKYFFEVSSPGIERKLKKISHFEQSIGSDSKVVLRDGREFIGVIKATVNSSITLDDKTIGEVTFEFDEIKKARTIFEWK
jgi:ribosome maturation factor RimP